MRKSKKYVLIIAAISFIIAIGLVLCVVFFSIEGNWKDFLISLSTTLIGIVVSIYMIEYIVNNARKQEQDEESVKKVGRILCILGPFLGEYQKAVLVISNKIMDMNDNPTINKNFPFTNLSEIYEPQILAKEGFLKTKVELYFEKLDRLKDFIMNILLNVDLTKVPKLADLFARYIEEMERDYPKGPLLKNLVVYTTAQNGKQTKMTTHVSRKIREYKEESLEGLKGNHFLLPVKRLYEIIQYNIDFIENLLTICNSIIEGSDGTISYDMKHSN